MRRPSESATLPTEMNTDAFEGSETVDGYRGRRVPVAIDPADIGREHTAETCGGCVIHQTGGSHSDDAYVSHVDVAVDRDMRLKRCGLVYNEGQLTGQKWVAPPGGTYPGIVKVLPLYLAKPTPRLEITATDGEKYLLPADFKGDWFSIRSPKGVDLIA